MDLLLYSWLFAHASERLSNQMEVENNFIYSSKKREVIGIFGALLLMNAITFIFHCYYYFSIYYSTTENRCYQSLWCVAVSALQGYKYFSDKI